MMKRFFRLGLTAFLLAVLAAGLSSCLRDDDEMPLRLNFYKNIDGSQVLQGAQLEIVIEPSKECQISVVIDGSVFSVDNVSESRGYFLPTYVLGQHKMDVQADCDGGDTQSFSWIYEVLAAE